jgi:GH35 family endo-1,4-beta-xylanase
MHNLLWDSAQQPKWALALLDAAEKGDANAKAELRKAISDRIAYYVRDRGRGYQEVDVLNESEHKPKYLKVVGLDGVAAIYKECADALRAAGSDARTFVNEYNLLQYSQRLTDGKGGASDPFANWYREHVEALNAAGAEVGGFGIQYYADTRTNTREPHSAARIHQAFQNLSITGLPVSLTEFGIKAGGDDATNIRIMDETLRMTFGTPVASGFLFFGFWEKAMWEQAPAAMLVTKDWKLTPLGEAFARRMAGWRTELDATVDADGAIRFTGYLGDYDLVVNGNTKRLSIVRGTTSYDLQ